MLLPAVVSLLLGAAAPEADPSSELVAVARTTKAAVVYLERESSAGDFNGSGSGFFVREDGLVVTNHHVIDRAERVVAVLADGKRVAVRGVLASRSGPDLALLKLEGEDYPVLSLATSDPPADGSRVLAVGAPRGLAGSVSEGIVAAFHTEGLPNRQGRRAKSWMRGVPLVQHTAPIAGGSSGSPLVTLDGQVVGVNQSSLGDVGDLNFAVGVEAVRAMIDATDLEAAPTPFTDRPRRSRTPIGVAVAVGLAGLAGLVWRPRRREEVEHTSTTLHWNGRAIQLRSSLELRYLFLATGTEVRVGGEPVAQCGGFVSSEVASGTFQGRDGRPHRIEARLRSGLLPGASCTLLIDGLPVWSGRQPVDNLLAVFPAILFLAGAGVASVTAIFG